MAGNPPQRICSMSKDRSKETNGADRNPRRERTDIVDQLDSLPTYSTLARAVHAAGLAPLLRKGGRLAMFAPTNRAFAKLPKDQLEALLGDRSRLARLLRGHIVASPVAEPRLGNPTAVTSLDGDSLNVAVNDGVFSVNGARVVKPRARASNGVLRGIDTVLLQAG